MLRLFVHYWTCVVIQCICTYANCFECVNTFLFADSFVLLYIAVENVY